jgi:hypothetical protein
VLPGISGIPQSFERPRDVLMGLGEFGVIRLEAGSPDLQLSPEEAQCSIELPLSQERLPRQARGKPRPQVESG